MKNTLYKGEELNYKKLEIDPYIPPPNLVKAVQLAQILQRPLLVKGEPGCGKSKLAEAVAAELHKENFRKYFFEWNIKSTSKALEGLYYINNLQRLSDANIEKEAGRDLQIKLPRNSKGQFKSSGNYIELGQLGKAFVMTYEEGLTQQPVVLIDEIDKADIDFPNDLLLEMDRMEFTIPEAKDLEGGPVTIKAKTDFKPLFIITSNDEKPLPAAFLRRCLFHYIDFSEIDLNGIVKARYPSLETTFVEKAVGKFKEWRKKIEDTGTGNKNISTGELLDWIKVVNFYSNGDNDVALEGADGRPSYEQALLKDVESIKVFTAKKTQPA